MIISKMAMPLTRLSFRYLGGFKESGLLRLNNKCGQAFFSNISINGNLRLLNNETTRNMITNVRSVNYCTQKTAESVTTDADKTKSETVKPKELTRKEKLKLAVKEYGSTVIIFHISISLVSLGTCYLLVSSGIDVESFLTMIGFSADSVGKLATTSGTFVAAYAIHKVFAPVRISITLGATPLIVRYLRQIGWLKKP